METDSIEQCQSQSSWLSDKKGKFMVRGETFKRTQYKKQRNWGKQMPFTKDDKEGIIENKVEKVRGIW